MTHIDTLKRAILYDQPRQVMEILAVLGDVDYRLIGFGDSGMTSLHYACVSGSANVVAALVNAGSDVYMRDDGGRLPVEWAYRAGHIDICRVLEKHACDAAMTMNVEHDILVSAIITIMKSAITRHNEQVIIDIDGTDPPPKVLLIASSELQIPLLPLSLRDNAEELTPMASIQLEMVSDKEANIECIIIWNDANRARYSARVQRVYGYWIASITDINQLAGY